jgi:hypothetical protein
MKGECVVALARRRPSRTPLPEGLQPLPGPTFVVAESYTRSPVGPYLAFAVARPARLGVRPGLCFTTVAVNSPECRLAGRNGWGFPAELADLAWSARGDERELVWPERGLRLVGEARRLALPALLPMRSLQRRDDGPVLAGGWLWGLARRARVEVTVDDEDPLIWLVGRHPGLAVSGLNVIVRPARQPHGSLADLAAPVLSRPKPAPPVPAESSAKT